MDKVFSVRSQFFKQKCVQESNAWQEGDPTHPPKHLSLSQALQASVAYLHTYNYEFITYCYFQATGLHKCHQRPQINQV